MVNTYWQRDYLLSCKMQAVSRELLAVSDYAVLMS